MRTGQQAKIKEIKKKKKITQFNVTLDLPKILQIQIFLSCTPDTLLAIDLLIV